MRLAIISDPHCGEPRRFWQRPFARYHDRRNFERFREIVSSLNKMDEDFRLVVLGDLTDRSTPKEFSEVLAALNYYQGERYIVPGNHDVTSPGRMGLGYHRDGHTRFRWVAEDINGIADFPLVIQCEGYKLILLDSSAHDASGTLFARGRIGSRQLAFLAASLADEVPTVVAMHHYPERVNPTLAVSDASDLMEICARDHVTIINGHRHREGEYPATQKRPRILTHGKCVETGRVRLFDPVTGASEWVRFL